MRDWIIEHKKDLTLFILLFLIASLSFALGYLSSRETGQAPIIIETDKSLSVDD